MRCWELARDEFRESRSTVDVTERRTTNGSSLIWTSDWPAVASYKIPDICPPDICPFPHICPPSENYHSTDISSVGPNPNYNLFNSNPNTKDPNPNPDPINFTLTKSYF